MNDVTSMLPAEIMEGVTVQLVQKEDDAFTIIVNDSLNRRDVEMEIGLLMGKLIESVAQGMAGGDPDAKVKLLNAHFVDDPEDAPLITPPRT